MEKNPSAQPPTPTAQRLAREAEALRENLAKRKQQSRLRQTEEEKPEDPTKE